MNWEPGVKPTIKGMSILLIVMGIIFTLALTGTGFFSERDLARNRDILFRFVLPLDKAAMKIREGVMDLTKRRADIVKIESLKTLSSYGESSRALKKYGIDIQKIKDLGLDSISDSALKTMENSLDTMVQQERRLIQSVYNRIILDQKIMEKINGSTEAFSRLFYETLEMESSQFERDSSASGTPFGGIVEKDLRTEISALLGKRNDTVMKIVELNRLGYRIGTTDSMKKLEALVSLVEKLELVSENKTGKKQGPYQKWILSTKLLNRFDQLKNMLIRGDDSIAFLRKQFLEEVRNTGDAVLNSRNAGDTLLSNLKMVENTTEQIRAKTEGNAWLEVLLHWIVWSGAVGCAFFILFGFFFYRKILPINDLIDFADTLSQGDLTARVEIDQGDEIGLLAAKLFQMSSNLGSLIGQVQRSGIQITSSATELTATAKQQEAVMKTQVESTNDVVRSIGEITGVSEELVETMRRVASMSEQTADFAASGQSDLSSMEAAMNRMENASKSISRKLEAINEKAVNITSVVTTITKVADQTDLLSLNAAIEAEKAGEYGRGFTVVAREIRRLADQTAVATLDIDQMVKEMQSAVTAGVMEMDAFITEVQQSAESVGKISKQLNLIIDQVQMLTPSFEGVNKSMETQSENARKINQSMVNLSEELQQTVESLRESFMAIEQLNEAARGLQDEVNRFKLAS